jgi:TolB-like protein
MAEQTGTTKASMPSDAQLAAVTADPQASAATGTWERIKEHKILQWGLGYFGAAIAIAHGQELMAEAFDWPHLIGRILMSVLVLGLPLVLTLAWYHGHKGLRKVGAGELAILSVLVLIAAGLLVVFVRVPNEHLQTRATAAEQQNVAQSAQATVAAPEGVSLAVLPFVDMSPEHNQEYFSDGLAEELLNQLAQIKELRVTGRTSSFSFKGKNEDLRAIGEKLGVANLLEGSVRKEGNHLRITAQLINAKDGTHLWSQTFDRELTGVFAVQEEIAMAVSGALSITLDVGEMSREKGGTTNVEAYDKYLRARKLYLGFGSKDTVQAAQTFRDALVLDPNFGRGWLGLYDALRSTLITIPETQAAARKEMAEVSAHIVKIAPNAWWAQATRAYQLADQHKWSEAEAALNAAMASAPGSANLCGDFSGAFGRAQEAVACAVRQREADPLSLGASGILQLSLDAVGRFAEAQAEYERSKDLSGAHAVWDWHAMRRLWSSKGANPAAVEARFRYFLKHEDLPMPLNHIMVDRLGDRAAALTAIRQAFADPANQDGSRMNTIARYADHYGDLDLTFAAVRRSFVDLHFTNLGWLWSYYETNFRSDPRFKDLLRDLGLVDYFRASGNWGDFCKPLGKDDFECH